MYAEKEQWFTFIIVGVIAIVSLNIWAAKRDIKGLQMIDQYEQPVYKQLPVIPFANEQ